MDGISSSRPTTRKPSTHSRKRCRTSRTPRKDYTVIYLKHADAYSVKINLDDFFQTDKKDTGEDRFRRSWNDDDSSNKTDDSPKLSRPKPMRFMVSTSQTNSILVAGGNACRPAPPMRELVEMYNNPRQTNTHRKVRCNYSTSSIQRPRSSPMSSRTFTATC